MAAAPPGGDAARCACRRLCACALRAMRLCTNYGGGWRLCRQVGMRLAALAAGCAHVRFAPCGCAQAARTQPCRAKHRQTKPGASSASAITACGRSSHPGFPPVSREVGEVQHKSVVAPDATVLAALSQSTLIVKLSAIVYRVLRMNRWRNRGFFAGQWVCLVS